MQLSGKCCNFSTTSLDLENSPQLSLTLHLHVSPALRRICRLISFFNSFIFIQNWKIFAYYWRQKVSVARQPRLFAEARNASTFAQLVHIAEKSPAWQCEWREELKGIHLFRQQEISPTDRNVFEFFWVYESDLFKKLQVPLSTGCSQIGSCCHYLFSSCVDNTRWQTNR